MTEKYQRIGEGHNQLLGDIICYSCQSHCPYGYDKVLGFAEYEVMINSDGSFEVSCEKTAVDDLLELHEQIVKDIKALSSVNIHPFGSGVRLTYQDRNLECCKCGSHEFCAIES